MIDRCVCCGEIIPEGTQVCQECAKVERTTNICENVCPCTECETEQEDCELAKAYIKLQEVKQAILRAAETIGDN